MPGGPGGVGKNVPDRISSNNTDSFNRKKEFSVCFKPVKWWYSAADTQDMPKIEPESVSWYCSTIVFNLIISGFQCIKQSEIKPEKLE